MSKLKSLSRSRRPKMITFFISLGFFFASILVAGSPPGHYDPNPPTDSQLIFRATGGDLSDISDRYGLQIVRQRDSRLALVEVSGDSDVETIAELLATDPEVETVEKAVLTSLPERQSGASLATPTPQLQQNLSRTGTVASRCFSDSNLQELWGGYADQWALDLVNLPEAQLLSPACGSGITVAIIDTGVDPDHPALEGALLPGYDFLLRQPGMASEWSSLEQSVQAILEENMRAFAAQSVQAILEGNGELVVLDSALGVILDPTLTVSLESGELDSFFGHGTMVAGLIRLSAPAAQIMPLRVFDSSGSAHLYDIVDAIYYAVDHGAEVINMSFSMESPSKELRRALKYAREHGVVTVAAAGNDGSLADVYPAADPRAIGVASTSDDDQLSTFSNYGASLVKLAAPGEGIVSTYPGDHYAAGWGTSFAAPLVAGTVALLYPLYDIDQEPNRLRHLLSDLYQGTEALDTGSLIGKGRLDALGSFLEGASGGE